MIDRITFLKIKNLHPVFSLLSSLLKDLSNISPFPLPPWLHCVNYMLGMASDIVCWLGSDSKGILSGLLWCPGFGLITPHGEGRVHAAAVAACSTSYLSLTLPTREVSKMKSNIEQGVLSNRLHSADKRKKHYFPATPLPFFPFPPSFHVFFFFL